MAPKGINRPGYSSPRTPTGINRPGYSSPKPPTGVNRPGTSSPNFSGYSRPDRDDGPNIVMKSKPNVPTFRQPPSQSVFAPTTSSFARKQYYDRLGGGVAPLADIRNITERFQRAADIPLFQQRQKNYNQFMQATGGTGNISGSVPFIDGRYVLSMQEPTLTARQPTFGEAGQDFLRGAGAFADALVEKGTPMMNLAKSLFGGVQNFFTGSQGPGTTAQGPQNLGLTPGQLNLYNNLVGNGMNPAMALEQAKRYVPEGPFPKSFAVGGIATLN